MGVCFIVLGLRFALHNVWENARVLGFVGIGLFALVLVGGVTQPRVFHPKWYGRLQDQLGKQRLMRLQRKAQQTPADEWALIVASDASFDQWVDRNAPSAIPPRRRRGYSKKPESESDK